MNKINPSFQTTSRFAWFWALVGLGVIAVVTVLGFVRFPQITGSLFPSIGVVTVLVLFPLLIALLLLFLVSKMPDDTQHWVLTRSARVSSIVGMLWVAYTLFTHFVIYNNIAPTLNAFLLTALLVSSLAAFFTESTTVALNTKHWLSGLTSGLLSGYIVGVLALLTVLIMLEAGMGTLVQHMNAAEMQNYQSSGWTNREAWYYWNEEIFGGLGDFLLLVVSSAILGAIGAGIGRLLAAFFRKN